MCHKHARSQHTVTNAAGGLNENYEVGDIVCLNDVGFDIHYIKMA